jgi:hypothetical protein
MKFRKPFRPKTTKGSPIRIRAMIGKKRVKDLLGALMGKGRIRNYKFRGGAMRPIVRSDFIPTPS